VLIISVKTTQESGPAEHADAPRAPQKTGAIFQDGAGFLAGTA
jgi:hypothetical protein